MWKLVDYKKDYYDNGCDVDIEEYYLIKNKETEDQRWVDGFTLGRFKDLGLLKEN